MNKKGFTLIEMIVTVTLLCTILLLVVPSILSQLSSRTDELKKTEQKIIVEAAKVYVSKYNEQYSYKGSESKACIPLKTLKDEGLYSSDSRTKYFGNNDNYSVVVTIKAKTKTYEFQNSKCG